MSDIAIPAADAKRLADYLRNFHFHGMSEEQDRLADLLDPPATTQGMSGGPSAPSVPAWCQVTSDRPILTTTLGRQADD